MLATSSSKRYDFGYFFFQNVCFWLLLYQTNFFIITPVAPDWKSSCRGCGNIHAEGGELWLLLLLSLLWFLLISIIIIIRIGGTGRKASEIGAIGLVLWIWHASACLRQGRRIQPLRAFRRAESMGSMHIGINSYSCREKWKPAMEKLSRGEKITPEREMPAETCLLAMDCFWCLLSKLKNETRRRSRAGCTAKELFSAPL